MFIIKEYQEGHQKIYRHRKGGTGLKIGGAKTKKQRIRERNDFIYEHKHLPRKEIMHLLSEKYGPENTLDYAYIGKIISIENKRRKEP